MPRVSRPISSPAHIYGYARGGGDWQAIAAESPVVNAILSASETELAVLEEIVARQFAQPAKMVTSS